MSGTLPTIAVLDTSPESPSNTAFRPFRTIDLVGGTVFGATITVAAGLVAPVGTLAAQLESPLPGYVTYSVTAATTEALQTLLSALQFTYVGATPSNGPLPIAFELTIYGGSLSAVQQLGAGVTLDLLAPDAPTTINNGQDTAYGGNPNDPFAFSDLNAYQVFYGIGLADADPGVILTLTISWDLAKGTLFNGTTTQPDIVPGAGGSASVTLSGTVADLNAAANQLRFRPTADLTPHLAFSTTRFTMTLSDGTNNDAVTQRLDFTVAGVQSGTTATLSVPIDRTLQDFQSGFINLGDPYTDQFGQPVDAATRAVIDSLLRFELNDDQSLRLFAGLDIDDPDAREGLAGRQTLTATVALSNVANGRLSAGGVGSYNAATGQYVVAGSSEAVEAALLALVFTPTAQQVAAGESVTTTFTLTLDDGYRNQYLDYIIHSPAFTAVVTAEAVTVSLAQAVLNLGTLAEGTLSAGLGATLLGNAQSTIPGHAANFYIAAIDTTGTAGVVTLGTDGSLTFEADGFNSAATTDSFRYTIADGGGGQATGTVRFTISGPTLATRLLTAGNDVLSLATNNNRIIGFDGNDTITAGATTGAGAGGNRIFGGDGNDLLTVNGTFNLIEGGDGADTIRSGLGNATVDGGAGDNVITIAGALNSVGAGDGRNTLSGTASNSRVTFGDGNNRVDLGGAGNVITLGDGLNTVSTGTGAATIHGGDGGNTITARAYGNTIETGAGNDVIDAGPGLSIINSGDGADVLRLGLSSRHSVNAGAGNDTVSATTAGGGNHTIRLGAGNDAASLLVTASTVFGEAGADRLTATGNFNLLDGGADADTLIGSTGLGVTLQGGNGDDSLTLVAGNQGVMAGGDGNDRLTSGNGADSLNGGAGDDWLDGGLGNDILIGGAGADTLNGNAGTDVVQGGLGNDVYIVTTPGDVLSEAGGDGWDVVQSAIGVVLGAGFEELRFTSATGATSYGNAADNVMTGNTGNDVLQGLGGADTLAGGGGADTLVGGVGDDWLTGGAGLDQFRYNKANEGGDSIFDFTPVDDSIAVLASGFGGGLTAGMNAGTSGRFVTGYAATSAPGVGQFYYRTFTLPGASVSTGELNWDANGVSAGGVTVIAYFIGGPLLTAADIVIV
jgi:Ca2+-binding RTX toxin-like protein